MSNIIFDFDGTLADTFEVVVNIFHNLTKHHHKLPADEIERLRGMPLMRVAEELRIPPWRIPLLLAQGRRQMTKRMPEIHTFPGMQKATRELHQAGHRLYIMSSNSVQNIELFLTRHEMNTYFVKVYGNVGLFDKARALHRIMRRSGIKRSETTYIGDEVRDIEAAQKAEIGMIAVAWGYNNELILAGHAPDAIAATPEQIIEIVDGFYEKS